MAALDPVTGIANVVDDVLTRVIPDPIALAQAKAASAQMMLNGELQQMTAQAGIITAEAASSNKLTSSWRPMLMYIFMAVVANNYIIAPYLQAMFHFGLQLVVPSEMWDLIKLGVGGYVMGRSGEKIIGQLAGTSPTQAVTKAVQSTVQSVFKGN